MVLCLCSKFKDLKIFVILWILFGFYTIILSDSSEEEGETVLEDFLICRSCGSDIALSNFIIVKQSDKALVAANETLFGKTVLVQVLENPLGSRFEVVALKRASCARVNIWSTSFSWFPGYAWKLCLCPKCSSHLGWMFEPIETATPNQIFPTQKGFYLIVLDNTIAESEIKSLIVPENIVPQI